MTSYGRRREYLKGPSPYRKGLALKRSKTNRLQQFANRRQTARFYAPHGEDQPTSAPELKYKDSFLTFDEVVPSGQVKAFFQPVEEGTGPSQRTGNVILIESIQIRGYVTFSPQNNEAQSSVAVAELYIVLDTQFDNDTPDANNIFVLTAGLSLPNLQNSNRFRIIHRETLALKSCSGGPFWNPSAERMEAWWGNDIQMVDYFKKINIKINYGPINDDLEPSVRRNHILAIFYSNAFEEGVTDFAAITRIRYIDDK